MSNLWLKIKKIFLIGLLLSLFILLLLGGAIHIYSQPRQLEVDFLNVGQGDSALIKIPSGEVILIDGGPDNRTLRRLGENLPFYRRRIDTIILSHYHDDHAVGLVEIIKRYRVKNLIYAPVSASAPAVEEMLAAAAGQSLSVLAFEAQAKISYNNGCFINLLNPVSLGIKPDGNNSLVARLDCDGQQVLFTGDNSLTVEKALVNSDWDLSATVFKASHHGSNSANSELFLSAVSPKLMVISVGADNKFGHPHPQVMARADNFNLTISRTDKLGTIKIFSR